MTGSRIEEPAHESLVATDVIRREEIEQSGARDAAELLEEREGLTITRSFAGSALLLRGLDPEYTLILVDGDRVPGQTNGSIDLNRYGVENIERVEIVRGPGSALYGSDAIGGVVNIITRLPQNDFEADGRISYGEQAMLLGTGRVAARVAEPLHLQLTGGYHSGDSFRTSADTGGSGFEQADGGFKLWYQPDAKNRVVATASYLQRTLEGVDKGAGGAVFDRTQQQEQLGTALEYRLIASDKVELVSRASYGQFRDQYLSDQRRGTELDRYEDNREHLGQLTSVLQIKFSPANKTTFGWENLFQRLDSERLTTGGHRYRLAGFAQHAFRAYKRRDTRFDIVPGLRLDVDSQFGTQLSPKLALQFEPQAGLILRASYGRGFRAPSFQELLLRFENPTVGYVVAGNPDLGAETSHGFDAGVTWAAREWLDLGATFFRNDLTNMIAIVSGATTAEGTRYTYDNVTSAWTMGVESFAAAHLDEELSVRVGWTAMGTHDGENDRVLEGRPTHRISTLLHVAPAGWDLDFNARCALQLGRVFFRIDDQEVEHEEHAPPLAQLDLRVSKHLTRHLELAVGVDNLLNAGDEFTVLRPRVIYGSVGGSY